jgi:hypothetical protein
MGPLELRRTLSREREAAFSHMLDQLQLRNLQKSTTRQPTKKGMINEHE